MRAVRCHVASWVALGCFAVISPAGLTATEFVQSEAPDQAAAPYEFVVERDEAAYDGLRVWGKLVAKNDGAAVRDAGVLLIAYDADGKFLGRQFTEGATYRSGGGPAAYVEATINIGRTLPARVVYEVISKSQSTRNVESVASTLKTSADADAIFLLEGIRPSYDGVNLIGTVQNKGKNELSDVQVVVTAFDAAGNVVGRGRSGVFPRQIGVNQVSFVDGLSLSSSGDIARIEWKVLEASDY